MNKQEVKSNILKAIRDVPLISTTASQLLQLTGDAEHGLLDVVKVVKYDAALTSRVLRVVNAAAFALRKEISSIDRAVSLLGEDTIIGIALADAASHIFESNLEGYAGARNDLWNHDLRTAVAAKMIATYAVGKVSGDVAFTCGLLHDIGKAVLSDFLKNTYEKLLSDIGQGKYADYLSAERGVLGIDHPEVGFELAKYWNLPEPLPHAILYHHNPAAAEPGLRALVYTVHLGDIVAMMAGCGTSADILHYSLDVDYKEYIDLTADDLATVMLKVDEEFNKLTASLGMT